MKKKGLIALLLCLVMVLALAGCGKPKTLEEYVKNDSEVSEQIQAQAEASNLTVEFKGNDVIYTYDYANMQGMTEEVAKSPELAAQLESAISGATSTFVNVCKQLEDETKISGIRVVVNYVYGDYVIMSKTYNASGEE